MSSNLPTQDEQDWLLERLARLVEKRGAGPLVTASLVKPSPRFFPDPWRPGLEGARVLAKRLLVYAGMEDFDAHVESFQDKAPHFRCRADWRRPSSGSCWCSGRPRTRHCRGGRSPSGDQWFWAC